MEKDDKKEDHPFPVGYEYIEEMVAEAAEKARVIDKQLEKAPRDYPKQPQHVPMYNPPGYLQSKLPVNPEGTIFDLEKQKKELEANIMKRVNREINDLEVDPETADLVRKATQEKMHPNPFRDKSEMGMKFEKGHPKNLDYSQDYMRQTMKNFREKEKEKADSTEKKIEPQQQPAPQQTFSMSQKFSQSLSYTKAVERPDPAPDKSKGRDGIDKV